VAVAEVVAPVAVSVGLQVQVVVELEEDKVTQVIPHLQTVCQTAVDQLVRKVLMVVLIQEAEQVLLVLMPVPLHPEIILEAQVDLVLLLYNIQVDQLVQVVQLPRFQVVKLNIHLHPQGVSLYLIRFDLDQIDFSGISCYVGERN
jgi:hypothetical protein